MQREIMINLLNMEATGSLITFNIDGKPLEKLIDVVSKGIGTIYQPRKIRKEADAQAYAIKVLENAKAVATSETKLIEAETAERIGKRIIAQEIKRQNNIDDIVEAAAEELNGKQVSDEFVEEDWATRFFGIVQDVSQEEMKLLWAKILAKEIEKPSSYSLRTLETLKSLSAKEAELFQKAAPYILHHNDYFIYYDTDVLAKYGIHYVDLAQLTECGLLQAGTFVSKNYTTKPDSDTTSGIIYGKYVVIMNLPCKSNNVSIPVIVLSKVGSELYRLLEPDINIEYIRDLSQYIKKENSVATLKLAEITYQDDEFTHYKTPAIDL